MGFLHRMRTGVQWRDLPERFGPWKAVHERHRLWSADGTLERTSAGPGPGQLGVDLAVASATEPGRTGRQSGGAHVIEARWRITLLVL